QPETTARVHEGTGHPARLEAQQAAVGVDGILDGRSIGHVRRRYSVVMRAATGNHARRPRFAPRNRPGRAAPAALTGWRDSRHRLPAAATAAFRIAKWVRRRETALAR